MRLDESDCHAVDLNEGIRSTVNMIRHRSQVREVELKMELETLPMVECYPARINQVFLNLLVNAIDASPNEAVVTVRSRVEEGRACVDVIDFGCGIDPHIRNRIFDPFFTTKRVGEGTGLGLSISYGIVRDHGGTIEVESEPAKGSTFSVRLPIWSPGKKLSRMKRDRAARRTDLAWISVSSIISRYGFPASSAFATLSRAHTGDGLLPPPPPLPRPRPISRRFWIAIVAGSILLVSGVGYVAMTIYRAQALPARENVTIEQKHRLTVDAFSAMPRCRRITNTGHLTGAGPDQSGDAAAKLACDRSRFRRRSAV